MQQLQNNQYTLLLARDCKFKCPNLGIVLENFASCRKLKVLPGCDLVSNHQFPNLLHNILRVQINYI